MAKGKCSIVGCKRASLLIESISKTQFESIESHIRSRLTNILCSTSIDPRYSGFYYNMLTNFSENYENTRLIEVELLLLIMINLEE